MQTALEFSSSNIEQLTFIAHSVLTLLTRCSFVNALKINQKKPKEIIFRPKRKLVINPPGMFLNDTVIDYVERFRSLGVTFSAALAWNAHINELCIAVISMFHL